MKEQEFDEFCKKIADHVGFSNWADIKYRLMNKCWLPFFITFPKRFQEDKK